MATAILVPGDDSKRLQAEQSASNMCDSSLPSPMKQTYVVSEDRLRELPGKLLCFSACDEARSRSLLAALCYAHEQ